MTGGRPCRITRETRPRVWTSAPGDEEPEGGRPEQVAPAQPRDEEHEQREHVEHHPRVEGLGPVEDHLVLDLADRLEARRGGVGPRAKIRARRALKAGRVLREPGEADPRPARRAAHPARPWRRRGAPRRSSATPPAAAPSAGRMGRKWASSASAAWRCWAPGAPARGELDEQPRAPLDLDCVLEAEVQVHALRQVVDGALEPRALLRLDLLGGLGLRSISLEVGRRGC